MNRETAAARDRVSPFEFDNSFARGLPGHYARVNPTPVAEPRLLAFNHGLADQLGLAAGALQSPEAAAILAGNRLAPGAEPIAMAYAGHQFGHFVPQLGDGRAILLGEVVGRDGIRRDIQLKGSGPTPFSRRGDGRAALGPVLREYLVSEAMHALGIPATRALAAVATGEPVYRETVLPGAVLVRVARSHIRVGTFQFFAARGETDKVKALAGHVIARHFPEIAGARQPGLALLDAVIDRQARLIAQWMGVGFVHGVMNTDNMAVSGETIDFGPCAFMDAYDPMTVFSSIDELGRYAYANQPAIAQWNLARLAETLLPLIDDDSDRAVAAATGRIIGFMDVYKARWGDVMRAKLGLVAEAPGDTTLIQDLLDMMQKSRADFTSTFRTLSMAAAHGNPEALWPVLSHVQQFDGWYVRWLSRQTGDARSPAERSAAMSAVNPIYIPRNHLVEHALQQAVTASDLSAFEDLMQVLRNPYTDQPGMDHVADPPSGDFRPYRTFCGT